jgi:putative oxidoreductase
MKYFSDKKVIIMGKCEKYVSKYNDVLYLVFRILVGGMFFLHGWDKIFVKGMAVTSLFGFAGVVELVVGAAVALGFFTRAAATLGGIQMIVAYFKVHVPKGLNPLANGGELALMYLAAFLVLLIYGAMKYSLEKQWLKKETF